MATKLRILAWRAVMPVIFPRVPDSLARTIMAQRPPRTFPPSEDKYHTFVDFMQDGNEYVGVIVPQKLYKATRGGADALDRWTAHPPPSIDFKVGGRLGVSIKAASEGIYFGNAVPLEPLSDTRATQWASRGGGVGHNLRIEWPGYGAWEKKRAKQIEDLRTVEGMNREAYHIAWALQDFLESPTKRVEGQWNGWDDLDIIRNNLDKVYLLRYVSVSPGSWQPVFSVQEDVFKK
ncbi:hypothetical protein BC629DRAFT_1736118 [Irpex lacteus]|nr:hypothetical protein BC629DRAFT_1736118 [Irpex lacteus]